jgi:hypothetical protein
MDDSQRALATARRSLAASFSALVLVGAFCIGGAVSQGAQAVSSTLNFCIDKKTSVVAQRAKCKATERAVAINPNGLTGPQGPKGDPAGLNAYNFTAKTPGATGVQIATDAYTALPTWSTPTGADYMVTQQFVVNAFPETPNTNIQIECFVGDINGYFSGISITAVPNPHAPAGVTLFNTGYGTATYLARGGVITPFCRNLSAVGSTFIASYPAVMAPVSKSN